MENKVIEIVKEVLETNNIDINTTQQECDAWDSMSSLNIVVELETEFDISFEPEEIAAMNSIKAICEVIKSKK